MSSPTSQNNVLISSTDGDTFTGPLRIKSVLVVPGSGTPTATLKVGSQKIFDAGAPTASSPALNFHGFDIQLSQSQTLTVNLAGTGTTVYIYTR